MSAPRVLPVRVPPDAYDVLLGTELLPDLGELVAGALPARHVALVSDENVAAHYLSPVEDSLREHGIRVTTLVLPAGEASKSIEQCEHVWARLAAEGIDRSCAVVALGGGMIGDLAGFCAATWMRGVPVVQVPTTVLSMTDAAIGGKTGVNLPDGKNLVGAFHQPRLVVADVETLSTLARRDVAAGLAEVVKCAVLEERAALERLRGSAVDLLDAQPDAILDAVALGAGVKVHIVTEDPLERTGRRALLNLGHTAGHALEKVTGYEALRHGEAVAIGLVVAARVALARGLVDEDLLGEISGTLSALDLPIALPTDVAPDAVVEATRLDKKTLDGGRRMVLPLGEGGADLFDVADEELRAALA